jgi:inner membrane protein
VALALPFSDARFFAPWRPLLTSPLGVEAFFSARAWDILANEMRLVWIPAAAALALGWGLAHLRRRAGILRSP